MNTHVQSKNVTVTKYDKLFAVFEELTKQLQLIPDEKLQVYVGFLIQMHEQLNKMLASNRGVTKSKMATGLEQVLREVPEFFSNLKPAVRLSAINAWNASIQKEFPEFAEKSKEKIAKILIRGHIKNESEYYLVRSEVDALESVETQDSVLKQYYSLIDKFEVK
ncbi:hypothetical protein [Iodobacter fluviatilis]|uniref:Uncharacterized protein n=1 Tax=Iodobacter fluviatilis TaxID=537 RepID=A0A377SUQ8_9NEIS|nr:hypothetical protein [Iodobacter fluviatilis]TCU82971.1 hypothetical protein EV682_11331 [Iodobacter fluviatilis]STR45794.1 Uncharacterised protein [Iodobacter fluviatilis]